MNSVFFYSDKCKHCKEAYELIQQIGLEKFLFKDIDKENNLPDIIDRVPSLITYDSDNNIVVYVENELFEYLMNMLNVEPFMINEMGSTISDSYSYMDNSGVKLNHAFQFLDKDVQITTPSESDYNKIINYDKYVAERDNDLKLMTEKV